MSKHSRVLDALSGNCKLTVDEIAKKTNLTPEQIEYVLNDPVHFGDFEASIRFGDNDAQFEYTLNTESQKP